MASRTCLLGKADNNCRAAATILNEPLINESAASPSRPHPAWKRAVDLAFALAAMPVLVLAVLAMTVVMKVSSPGPVLFRQTRVGYRGRRFKLYKFRTMHAGADGRSHQAHWTKLIQSSAPMTKLDGQCDARMIPGAWLLRASGVDELPQIFNVLRGEMSLVGPRPCIPYEYELYLPWQRERFNTMPGLTGLWQVSGKNRTTFAEMIRLDIHYVRHQSFWLDLKIILLTPQALLVQISDTCRQRRWLTVLRTKAAHPFRKLAAPSGRREGAGGG